MTFTARMYTNLGNRIDIAVPEWRSEAACRDADPALFFPERGEVYESLSEALAFCAGCPVRRECLEFGRNEMTGIWGGKTPRQRKPKSSLFAGFCEVCDEPMHRKSPQGPAQLYCSKACRQKAYLRRTA